MKLLKKYEDLHYERISRKVEHVKNNQYRAVHILTDLDCWDKVTHD